MHSKKKRTQSEVLLSLRGNTNLAFEYYRWYESGYSLCQIAQMYGKNDESVRSLLKNHGYKLRSRSEGRDLYLNPKNLKPTAILPTAPFPLEPKPTKPKKQSKPNVWADKISAQEEGETNQAMELISKSPKH